MIIRTLVTCAAIALLFPLAAGAVTNEEFVHAATFEKNDVLRQGLEEGRDVNATDRFGNTVLALTAFDGNDEMVRLLLDRGADVNKAATDGSTALMLAAQRGELSTVSILIDAGANLELRNTSKETALLVAISADEFEIAKRLVDAGANVNVANIQKRSALLIAKKSLDMVRYLVEHGADVDATELHGGTTTLNYLKRSDDYADVVEYLESRGAHE
ncbi:MAG: ankyrin repeat domain-containing protein [Woeseiaceae bacterium]|nr:ankyrin repeat domain-containing protein [Woeseiaceae bacterium]